MNMVGYLNKTLTHKMACSGERVELNIVFKISDLSENRSLHGMTAKFFNTLSIFFKVK